MFKSRWIIAVAFGLTVLSQSGQAQEQTSSTDGQTGQQHQHSENPALSSPVEIIESQAEANARKSSEEESRQREIADLAAQEGMNDSTESIKDATLKMRDYALYSTVAVWIGTALLFYTLRLTRQANKAAQAAVGVTRAVGRAQTRAYVFFNLEGIAKPFEIDIRNPSDISVDFEIENVGQTPARNLRHFAKIVIRNRSEKFGDEVIKIMGGQRVPDASLKPSGTVNATADSFGPFIESDFRDCFLPEGNKRIFLIGRIFYEDVFDDPHETKFCFYLEPIDRIRNDNFEMGLSRWEQYDQHNSAK